MAASKHFADKFRAQKMVKEMAKFEDGQRLLSKKYIVPQRRPVERYCLMETWDQKEAKRVAERHKRAAAYGKWDFEQAKSKINFDRKTLYPPPKDGGVKREVNEKNIERYVLEKQEQQALLDEETQQNTVVVVAPPGGPVDTDEKSKPTPKPKLVMKRNTWELQTHFPAWKPVLPPVNQRLVAHDKPWYGMIEWCDKLTDMNALAVPNVHYDPEPHETIRECGTIKGGAPVRVCAVTGELITHTEQGWRDVEKLYWWPSDYVTHYVKRFNVVPSEEFYDYVANFNMWDR